MISESGFSLGKSPFIVDDEGGDRVEVFESVACMEYLLERYGKEGQLLPSKSGWSQRTRVQSYLSFCETLMLHALAIVYAQWFTPDVDTTNKEIAQTLEGSMKANVQKDLDLLESALKEAKDKYGEENAYLCNGEFSIADIANAFSCEYGESCEPILCILWNGRLTLCFYAHSSGQTDRYQGQILAPHRILVTQNRSSPRVQRDEGARWSARFYTARSHRQDLVI